MDWGTDALRRRADARGLEEGLSESDGGFHDEAGARHSASNTPTTSDGWTQDEVEREELLPKVAHNPPWVSPSLPAALNDADSFLVLAIGEGACIGSGRHASAWIHSTARDPRRHAVPRTPRGPVLHANPYAPGSAEPTRPALTC